MDADAANERALAAALACAPRLVAVRPAREVVPGMRPELVLHAGPPAAWDELPPLVQAALAGAAELEGLARAELELGAAQDHGAMAGGGGAPARSPPRRRSRSSRTRRAAGGPATS